MVDTDCKLNPEADWATIRQLRAELAAVKAESRKECERLADGLFTCDQLLQTERAAHSETRKALEQLKENYAVAAKVGLDLTRERNESRASEAALRERVEKALAKYGADSLRADDAGRLTMAVRRALTADRTGQEGERESD